jgi:hypothetical protein
MEKEATEVLENEAEEEEEEVDIFKEAEENGISIPDDRVSEPEVVDNEERQPVDLNLPKKELRKTLRAMVAERKNMNEHAKRIKLEQKEVLAQIKLIRSKLQELKGNESKGN